MRTENFAKYEKDVMIKNVRVSQVLLTLIPSVHKTIKHTLKVLCETLQDFNVRFIIMWTLSVIGLTLLCQRTPFVAKLKKKN